jgi:cytoskeletal protein CcmA (bactofilin family)
MGIFGGKPPETKPAEPGTGAVPPPPRPAAAAPAPPAAAPQGGPSARVTCVIGPKITVKGEITGDEDVLVEGTVEGQIKISRDLRIGSGGVVKANVEAQSVVVNGEVVGDCQASTRVDIQATGRLTGNIRAPKIVVAEGAMFKGNSDMSSGRRDERKDNKAAAL